ncbi:hypothetical protein [Streptococcus mitis]|uniref:hypothetical protein n=1 Tax=Streptococcus mitis TaxID=28037 RepID=UPI0021B5C731|nr:hypothetical protein [Streptococcus mitis]
MEKNNYFGDATNVVSFFVSLFLKRGSVLGSVCDSFVVSFFAKEYQEIPKTKIKNVDLTTFYQGMQKNAKK